ncbi:MAG: Stp1/IreP family PP2C-type Ser/Thr phosphatase [Paenibacillus dendritiformis]|uniref:Stp1/IreP family PP2C-type Ser/Thr phosphatase n=1 Tax=Paenibacillus dendritiformis TaxID=130049 RepID=UPI00143D3EB0|nr:Stp1/IreP family PP2C-type Ser/Thr phosphatase [Paenibacillus dendritiformis]MDU5142263.1 Stp1/IreP family PP2C-type Ser/Thr phosphatase [Paenibacillus dendritiformis]NKI22690.1 Stp1/IreP family PP2C-type Ser/Thr phosphatase [Paenibacillus dendritiformis]NRG00952.1 Stp1/IreP family PP2C-type Ser/Thr phosphatase [Paenibacillus dendritiformis]
MRAVHRSDVGRVRAVNEDRAYVSELANGYDLAVVADGMGGHQAGDIASRLAVETVVSELAALPRQLEQQQLAGALEDAILRANHTIFHIASQDEKYHHMGTTIVAVLFPSGQTSGYIGHIGDSRAYRIGRRGIVQLTEDHTLVNELVKSGQIGPEEAERHPRRNVLVRALGTDEQVKVDIIPVEYGEDDTLLLCSDGLTSMVDEDHIWSTVIDPSLPLSARADRLLSQALEAGGDDNVTVVLLEHPDAGKEE